MLYAPFKYMHMGSLAYIGNSAVFDIGSYSFAGGLVAMCESSFDKDVEPITDLHLSRLDLWRGVCTFQTRALGSLARR